MENVIKEITTLLVKKIVTKEEADKILIDLYQAGNWIAYDWNKPETRPKKYDKYFVHRKDGKIHWETWNGSGWAYNGNVITHYQEIKPPSTIEFGSVISEPIK